MRGRLYKFKWIWDGRVQCDDIIGESVHHMSRKGAVQAALQDYSRQVDHADLLAKIDVQQFQ